MPASHVTPPTSRLAPESIVRQLREVDGAAELLYLGQGHWCLGRCRPSVERRMAGDAMLAKAWTTAREGAFDEASWYRRLRFARAVREGFAPMESYHPEGCDCPNVSPSMRLPRGEPDGRVVRVFARAVGLWRRDTAGREAFRALDAHRAARRAAVRAEYGDTSRAREAARLLRNPVTVSVPRAVATPTPSAA